MQRTVASQSDDPTKSENCGKFRKASVRHGGCLLSRHTTVTQNNKDTRQPEDSQCTRELLLKACGGEDGLVWKQRIACVLCARLEQSEGQTCLEVLLHCSASKSGLVHHNHVPN